MKEAESRQLNEPAKKKMHTMAASFVSYVGMTSVNLEIKGFQDMQHTGMLRHEYKI